MYDKCILVLFIPNLLIQENLKQLTSFDILCTFTLQNTNSFNDSDLHCKKIIRKHLKVSAMCCYIGMISPRTSMMMSSLGVLYFLTCLFILISLINHLFGSREAFATILLLDKKPIDFQSPPFCCCCSFLPKAKSSV